MMSYHEGNCRGSFSLFRMQFGGIHIIPDLFTELVILKLRIYKKLISFKTLPRVMFYIFSRIMTSIFQMWLTLSGDFRMNSISDFIPNLIEGYSELDLVFRTWAHVEWRDEREVSKKLSLAEKEADPIVTERNFFLFVPTIRKESVLNLRQAFYLVTPFL
jgi:hypothetical protein